MSELPEQVARMKVVMQKLLTTESIDAEIRALDNQLAQIPAELEKLESELSSAMRVAEESRSELEREELQERQLESQMRDKDALLEKLNQQTAQVSSNQAYEALQHEIAHVSEACGELENQGLELLDLIDAARQRLTTARDSLEELEREAPGRRDAFDGQRRDLGSTRLSLVERRTESIVGIDARTLSSYDRVRDKRHPAVTILDGNSCPECRIVLPRQTVSVLKRGESVHSCTSCLRLLIPAHLVDG